MQWDYLAWSDYVEHKKKLSEIMTQSHLVMEISLKNANEDF